MAQPHTAAATDTAFCICSGVGFPPAGDRERGGGTRRGKEREGEREKERNEGDTERGGEKVGYGEREGWREGGRDTVRERDNDRGGFHWSHSRFHHRHMCNNKTSDARTC